MLCEVCQQETASIHIQQHMKGTIRERHLCEACARQEGLLVGEEFMHSFTINNLLTSLLEAYSSSESNQPEASEQPLRCPECGLSYRRFRQHSRFGCAHCYSAFFKQLEPMLRRVHGDTQHRGKVPSRNGKSIQLQRRIEELRAELQKAVQEERYEAAAVLRDQVRSLEQGEQVVGI